MIDLETFKRDLRTAVDEAESKNGNGPDVHANLLKIIFTDIKECWDISEEGLEEILFVLKEVYPETKAKDKCLSLLYSYWS
jgi:hypothetical protein